MQIVLVKAGDGGLAYVYGGAGVAADTELWSPRDSISHIDFGWGKTTDTSNGNGGNGDNGNGTVTTPVIVTVTEPPTTTRQTIPFDEEPATVPPSVLPTVVEPTTTPAPATVAPATEAPATTEEVLGATVDRQLPRTGAASTALAQVGFGLLLVGAGLLAHSRRVAHAER